jgi:hypothetical protein
MLILYDHLIAPADNQSVETKLGTSPGERSQDQPAMAGREEARLHGQAGWRLGWTEDERPSLVRSPFFPPQSGKILSVAVIAVTDSQSAGSSATRGHARHQRVHTTGEVPRRLFPPGRVTASYKQAVKGSPEATAAGTASYRPCSWGCQQSLSSPTTREERLNRVRTVNPDLVFGIVSPTAPATKWPVGTSSWQPVGPLRNSPRYGVGTTRTKGAS